MARARTFDAILSNIGSEMSRNTMLIQFAMLEYDFDAITFHRRIQLFAF